MKTLISVLLCLAACLPVGCKKKASQATGSQAEGIDTKDPAVATALVVVEEFRKAWLKPDYKAAEALFTPELKKRYSEEQLRTRVVGLPNQEHKSCKVVSGRRVVASDDGKVEFTLRMTTFAKGGITDHMQEEDWRIVLVRYNIDWLIDEIPVPPRGLQGG